MHLLDATMFWNPVDGARRYIAAKHHWARRIAWRHTIVTGQVGEPGIRSVPSLPLPGSHGEIRLPWSRHASTRVLCRARPDIIEAGDPYRLAWSALDAAQTLGVPSVAFCHSNPEHLAGFSGSGSLRLWAQRAARRYAAHLYRQFDLVLAPSMAMVNHLRDWGLTRVVHQPLGVDGQVFHPARRNSPWREALDLPPDARLLVYTGRFGAEKNLATLVAATEMLGPRYWLLAVGAGPLVPSGPRVLVLPTIHRSAPLATVLASCDVFVHAGRHETFGLPALEAMACGLPVVCSQAEGLGELVDETVGRGVEGSSPEDFAVAIADVFKRDRAALARAARERALSHAWPRVLPLLWGHYRRLVGLNTRTCPERGLLQAR